MRKFKNLVIGGIESKIFNLILITVLLLTGTFVLISMNRTAMLTQLTSATSVHQQETTSAIISETMSTVARTSMKRTTDMEAQLVNDMFQDIKLRVLLVGDYAAKVLSDPDSYPAKPYAGPDASLNGQLVAQMIWADSADPAGRSALEPVGADDLPVRRDRFG